MGRWRNRDGLMPPSEQQHDPEADGPDHEPDEINDDFEPSGSDED